MHAPLFHPVIAAKEFVTADHIGEGRFGLNIVAGWNEDEFAMFGVQQREHADRYEFTQEWIDVVKRAWTEDEFDFDGKFFKLAGVRAKPKPFGNARPVIMNAGRSGPGQTFALRNCDAFFTSTGAMRLALAGTADDTVDVTAFDRIVQQVRGIKDEARKFGREIEVYTQGQVICRPTQREAEDYHHLRQCRERGLARHPWTSSRSKTSRRQPPLPSDQFTNRACRPEGIGGYPFVGTPDRVAEEFAAISRAGLRGIAISFVNCTLTKRLLFCARGATPIGSDGAQVKLEARLHTTVFPPPTQPDSTFFYSALAPDAWITLRQRSRSW